MVRKVLFHLTAGSRVEVLLDVWMPYLQTQEQQKNNISMYTRIAELAQIHIQQWQLQDWPAGGNVALSNQDTYILHPPTLNEILAHFLLHTHFKIFYLFVKILQVQISISKCLNLLLLGDVINSWHADGAILHRCALDLPLVWLLLNAIFLRPKMFLLQSMQDVDCWKELLGKCCRCMKRTIVHNSNQGSTKYTNVQDQHRTLPESTL